MLQITVFQLYLASKPTEFSVCGLFNLQRSSFYTVSKKLFVYQLCFPTRRIYWWPNQESQFRSLQNTKLLTLFPSYRLFWYVQTYRSLKNTSNMAIPYLIMSFWSLQQQQKSHDYSSLSLSMYVFTFVHLYIFCMHYTTANRDLSIISRTFNCLEFSDHVRCGVLHYYFYNIGIIVQISNLFTQQTMYFCKGL